MKKRKKKTIEMTVRCGLCISCGMCKGVCPRSCIRWERKNGMFFPAVDTDACVQCGLCTAVCPGLEMDYPENQQPVEALLGTVLESYNAWSRNAETRHVAASGGVVSTLLEKLLLRGAYDTAFVIRGYGTDSLLKTEPVRAEDLPLHWKDSDVPKSRYLPVSHERAVEYLKGNRQARAIFIGTSCAIRGLRNAIRQYKLNEENCLLIGLFCDKVFNYNISDYYSHTFFHGDAPRGIHFKNKESGGWPGNMKFFFEDGESCYLDKAERGRVKDYFMPERCLYCVDKLNVCADISLGDNYTEHDASPLGSNTVLLRTERGKTAWREAADGLEFVPVDCRSLREAQFLDGRLENLRYAALKQREVQRKTRDTLDLNHGMKRPQDFGEYERAWKHRRKMLQAGRKDDDHCRKVRRMLNPTKYQQKLDALIGFSERLYYAAKRRIR